jgi:phenylpropionate dioxygenase-like ring-hydroxylating dioxygenase large terminal subunit
MQTTPNSANAYAGYVTPIDGAPDAMITETTRGTPGGEYLRRFWQPVAYEHEIEAAPLRAKIMGEELVVFKDKSGDAGVLHLHCQHRGASLEYGRVEEHGIRCCYHGRVFGVDGTILEMPGEPDAETQMRQARQGAYPTHLYGGIVFAYMGPLEKMPPFPLYDRYELPGMRLDVGKRLPFKCNWVQIKENSMDPAHTAILHAWEGVFATQFGQFPEITWAVTPVGMAYAAARPVADKIWVRSTDIMMPNIHSITSVFEDGAHLKECSPPWITIWTVPEDDENSHQFVLCHIAEDDPMKRETLHHFLGTGQTPDRPYAERQQVPGDYDAMTSQGGIAPHSLEHLGTLDRGVAMFRQLLRDGVRDVQAGKDPHGLLRTEAPQPTYGSDLVEPISVLGGAHDDPDVWMAYAEATLAAYLKTPPFQNRVIPKPPPLPKLAAE